MNEVLTEGVLYLHNHSGSQQPPLPAKTELLGCFTDVLVAGLTVRGFSLVGITIYSDMSVPMGLQKCYTTAQRPVSLLKFDDDEVLHNVGQCTCRVDPGNAAGTSLLEIAIGSTLARGTTQHELAAPLSHSDDLSDNFPCQFA